MPASYKEIAFEDAIEQWLLTDGGYVTGVDAQYDRALALDTEELFTFIDATPADAWAQLLKRDRSDRDPSDPLFARRAVVHFAVDPDLVMMTTRLEGKATRFLPFNQGTGGPGQKGGAGNPAPASADDYATSYLWKSVWQRDAWL